jgi:hypothetical protein
MAIPRPYVYLPKVSDQLALMRELWVIGCKRGSDSPDEAARIWLGPGDNQQTDVASHPYVYLHRWDDLGGQRRINMFADNPKDYLCVNSSRAFVAYARRHLAPQTVPLQRVNAF